MKKNLKLESKTRSLFLREKVFFFSDHNHIHSIIHLCHVFSECDFEIVLNVSSQLNSTQPTQAVIYPALHILQSLCLPCAAPTARTVYLPSHWILLWVWYGRMQCTQHKYHLRHIWLTGHGEQKSFYKDAAGVCKVTCSESVHLPHSSRYQVCGVTKG